MVSGDRVFSVSVGLSSRKTWRRVADAGLRVMAIGIAITVVYKTNFSRRAGALDDSAFSSRMSDIHNAMSTIYGGTASKEELVKSAFLALPTKLDQVNFPAVFLTRSGEYCLVLSAEDMGSENYGLRCVDKRGSVVKRDFSEFEKTVSGYLSIGDDRSVVMHVGAGVLRISWLMWDFGEVSSGERCTAGFQISNEGNAPVALKYIKRSCGCLVVEHGHDLPIEVREGESQELQFGIMRSTLGEQSLQVTLYFECRGASELVELRIFASGSLAS